MRITSAKVFLILAGIVGGLASGLARAQNVIPGNGSGGGTLTGSGAPSNPCSLVGSPPFYINSANGDLYTCPTDGGSWVKWPTAGATTSQGSVGALQIAAAAGAFAGTAHFSYTNPTLSSDATGVLDLHLSGSGGLLLPGALSSGFVRVVTSTGAISGGELSGDCTTSASLVVTCTPLLHTSLNLSDLASATTARTNLGLGTVATHAATEFALAHTGTCTSSNIVTGTSACLATGNSGVLVTSAGSVPSISTTLPSGLTIPGFQASLGFNPLNPANNLADVSSVPGSRTALGLGSFTGLRKANGAAADSAAVAGTDYQIPFTATAPITFTSNIVACNVASSSQPGCLASADWTTFNGKQATLSITTTGTSGAATIVGTTLNVPQYQGALSLTTTGTSGAATLVGTTLNIPQYTGGSGCSGSCYATLQTNGSSVTQQTTASFSTEFLVVNNAGASRTDISINSIANTKITGLGTSSTHPATDFLLTANNLSDVTAATARTNLGLGTAATQATGTFLQTANNLSDVVVATARTNLGLDPNPAVEKFASDINALNFAACNGSTDDTAAFTTMSALAVNIHIPAGLTCVVNSPTIASHTHIIGGPNSRLLKLAGSTTTYLLTTSSKTDILLQNLILDGNSVAQTTSNTYSVFISGGSDVTFDKVTLQNSGTPVANMGGIDIFNASAVVKNSTFAATVLGNQVTANINNNIANRVQVRDSTFNGSQAKAIWIQNSGSEGVCNAEIAGVYINNVGDSAGDAGQTGNAISIFQCDYVQVHDFQIKGARYSGVRLTTSSWSDVHDGIINGAQETAVYCSELGGSNNHCHHITILNSASGINMTNVSSRSPDGRNVADYNTLINLSYYGIYAEHDIVTNNTADGVPFGFIAGHGVTSHDNIMANNSCTRSSTSYAPVDVCESVDIGMTGVSYVYNNLSNGLIAPTIATKAASNTPSNLVITGISKAASAVVTTSSTLPVAGSTLCFVQIAGMVEINGLCGVVSSPSGSTFTVAINSTGFTTFLATPAGGTAPVGNAVTVYSSGTTPSNSYAANVTFGVSSVFTRTGAVVATSGDYTASQVTNSFDLSANNVLGAHSMDLTDIVTPSNPAATHTLLYTKGGKVCSLDPSGNENCGGADQRTTKGDLLTFSTVPIRLPVGTTNGFVLTVDNTQASGLKYAASGTTVAYQNAGAAVLSSATFNLVNGSGLVGAITNVGGVATYTPAFDTALISTHDTVHANENFISSTNGTTTYTATMPYKALTSYTTGMQVTLVADTATTTTATLNIDSVGPISIKQSDGTTNPGTLIIVGRPYILEYDGTVFRMVTGVSVGGATIASTTHLISGDGAGNGSDSGLVTANVVLAVSPGAGIAHFAGSTQTLTSSLVSLTADVSGVLPTANIALALANQTSIHGLAITSSTGTLTITNAKTLSISNTLSFNGVDSASVNFGSGGAVVYSGGAGGTPTSLTLTNATGLSTAGLVANAVTSAKMAVVNTRRVCSMVMGGENGAALATTDIAPQGRQCFIPAAAHVVEITVAADAGTPAVVVAKNSAGTPTALSASLATAASGGIACANAAGSGTGIDGATTCAVQITTTALAAGDWIETSSSASASTAKRMSISVTYTID